jgi:hypothetical protein
MGKKKCIEWPRVQDPVLGDACRLVMFVHHELCTHAYPFSSFCKWVFLSNMNVYVFSLNDNKISEFFYLHETLVLEEQLQ